MRRLAAAAGMAVALHGLLLLAGGAWLSTEKPAYVRQPRPVTVRLLEPRRGPAPVASRALEEKAVPDESPPVQAKRPAVAFSSPASPATPRLRRPARDSPMPPRVLSPGSTPARKPHVPSRAAEESAPVLESHAPASGLETASVPEASGDAGLETPPLVEEAVPLYRENQPPPYPRVARRRGYEGTVLLEVLVTEEGRVGELRVVESSGHDLLDKASLRAVEAWRFSPGRRGDRVVAMRVFVPVRFRLQ